VSADERFILLLDGKEFARGPDRGMPERWFYHSYEIDVEPGEHVLEAIVWQMGAHAPLAQLSWRGGFVLKAEGAYDSVLTTGKAEWKVAELSNTEMTGKGESSAWGAGQQPICCHGLDDFRHEWGLSHECRTEQKRNIRFQSHQFHV
jgi:hypothetical protein